MFSFSWIAFSFLSFDIFDNFQSFRPFFSPKVLGLFMYIFSFNF